MKRMLCICGLIGLTVLPVDGGPGIGLKVTPAKSIAPATLRLITRIEPSAQNRALMIVADGEDFYRSSVIPLDGEQAPKILEMTYPDLPGGEYEISALLIDASGHQRAVAHEGASVIGFGGR